MNSEKLPRPGALILIPALNEEAAIGKVLDEIRTVAVGSHVLVIDDGSTDETVRVASGKGAIVAQLPFNLGVGGALRTGLTFASRHGYDVAVQLDADGQHDPNDVKRLVAAIDQGADLVIGSRFTEHRREYRTGKLRGGAMSLLRIALRLMSGQRLTDTTSGFRAFGPAAIQLFARHQPAEYLSDTVESILVAAYNGLKIVEVPVKMRQRSGGTPSTRNLKLVYHYFRLLISMIATFPFRRRKVKGLNVGP